MGPIFPNTILIHYAPFYNNVARVSQRASDRAKKNLSFFSLQKERAIGVETADALELERGADGRELSIGFSKVVHQTSPRPCGGGKSVVNRQA